MMGTVDCSRHRIHRRTVAGVAWGLAVLHEAVGVRLGRHPRSLVVAGARPTLHLLLPPSGVEDRPSSCLRPRASGVLVVVAEGRLGCPWGAHRGARPGSRRRHLLGSLPHHDMEGVVHHSLPGRVVVVLHESRDRQAVLHLVGTVSVGQTHHESLA